ncbi:armadillo repeat-containing protein 8-like isoform X2 [Tubulanus polymorphus]|uniref:armadillo repeat-containing protein 8-like isoform X2 n=1 Tax=Tubulanus polymorphus TaxID=672921 RepID=UPI003DA60C89
MIPSYMEVDQSKDFVAQIFSSDADKCLEAIRTLRNTIIGNNKQKKHFVNLGIVPRLLHFMIDENCDVQLMIESAVVLGSLSKGTEEDIQGLIENGCVSVLLKGIFHSNLKYVESCLRCLRTIMSSQYPPIDCIYQDSNIIPHLINLLPKSVITQECITHIFATACKTPDQQVVLCSSGIISALTPMLSINIYNVQMPTLRCLAVLCHQNQEVAMTVASTSHNGETVPNLVTKLLARDKPPEMQMSAAKCLTYLCRAGVIHPEDSIIVLKALPTLIRMCKKDRSYKERIEAAETLAYLIEVDTELQQAASITDHVIKTLADFFKHNHLSNNQNGDMNGNSKKVESTVDELHKAAFLAFASLGANDEEIRRKIIESENMMDHIVTGLENTSASVPLAAVTCLHSLSRSVQQLRTSFQDHAVWKPLMKLLKNAPDDVLTVASSTLCNLLLEFSPCKEPILEQGAVDLLVDLTKRDDPALRLNGIWALMNMAFQADQRIKSQILCKLGTDQLFRILADPNVNILMKTLGLLRNLLSNKPHIDDIMSKHGNQIMQAVILILEGDHPIEVKEQTLCILANVADGESAKDFIITNEDVLKKLMNYMIHTNVKLQTAATFCISNLIWSEEEGSMERQAKLREMGVQKVLQQLLSTNDSTLFDKVKTALQQFT